MEMMDGNIGGKEVGQVICYICHRGEIIIMVGRELNFWKSSEYSYTRQLYAICTVTNTTPILHLHSFIHIDNKFAHEL